MEKPKPRWVYPGATVLLAEDMKVNQKIFMAAAAPWKFTVDAVASGKEAVEAAEKKDYQLIFLDMKMPEMGGIEAAEIIRSRCDTPLVLVTADDSEDTAGTFGQKGFAAFVGKPINALQLQEVIEGLMPAAFRAGGEGAEGPQGDRECVQGGDKTRYRILEAFLAETRPLLEQLPVYAVNDLGMFETKVHGIKGTSLQIGRAEMSDSAEIMEMAAKTGNISFIGRHMEGFLGKLEQTLREVGLELEGMSPGPGTGAGAENTIPAAELFAGLKAGFESYDISRIEENLQALKAASLDGGERQLYEKAQAAYMELEYEMGADLLKDY